MLIIVTSPAVQPSITVYI